MEQLKGELKRSSGKVESLRVLEQSSALSNSREREVRSEMAQKVEKGDKIRGVKEKRLMSKSAQKYRSANQNITEKEG